MIEIYTDGACSGNPGPGGYGVVVVRDGKIIKAQQHFKAETTNNEMELAAILWAVISSINEKWEKPICYSDSAYAVNSLTNWMYGWKEKNWFKSDNQKPKNLDLIQLYDLYKGNNIISLVKIKGHKGIIGNELADKLATNTIKPEDIIGKEI